MYYKNMSPEKNFCYMDFLFEMGYMDLLDSVGFVFHVLSIERVIYIHDKTDYVYCYMTTNL
jgi:hypothetical protein